MMVAPAARPRPEVEQFCDWVAAQAALTRAAVDAMAAPPGA